MFSRKAPICAGIHQPLSRTEHCKFARHVNTQTRRFLTKSNRKSKHLSRTAARLGSMKNDSLHILLFGATGTIGRATALACQNAGHRVTIVTRQAAPAAELRGCIHHIGDVTNPDDLSRIVASAPFTRLCPVWPAAQAPRAMHGRLITPPIARFYRPRWPRVSRDLCSCPPFVFKNQNWNFSALN